MQAIRIVRHKLASIGRIITPRQEKAIARFHGQVVSLIIINNKLRGLILFHECIDHSVRVHQIEDWKATNEINAQWSLFFSTKSQASDQKDDLLIAKFIIGGMRHESVHVGIPLLYSKTNVWDHV